MAARWALVAGASSTLAHAQVNVEPLRNRLPAIGFGGEASASMTGYQGNRSGVIAGESALVALQASPHLVYLASSADYAEFQGEVQVSKLFAHSRYNVKVRRWVAWELYGQVEADRFRLVSLRELAGTGPRFTLLRSPATQLYGATAYMLEYTRYSDSSRGVPDDQLVHRSSNYLTLNYQPDAQLNLTWTSYVQFRFDEASDLRLLSAWSLDVAVNRHLAASIGATARYDTRVPSNVKPWDLEVKNSIKLTF